MVRVEGLEVLDFRENCRKTFNAAGLISLPRFILYLPLLVAWVHPHFFLDA